ncbi:MAG: hypothetical protein LC777_14030 [Actinobacteria bacterium]|nr:hypothetical protein [Actinomycetota bacterium]
MNATSVKLSRASAISRTRSTRRVLAHVEGRRLITHPIFVLGLAGATTQILALPPPSPSPSALVASDVGAVCTLLVTFLAASRDRRDHAQDTYLAQPVAPRLRTQAALLSLGYAGVVAAALATALTLGGRLPSDAMSAEGFDALRPLALLEFALYYVMAGALGVLLAGLTRHVHAALLAALVLFVSPLTVWSSLAFGLPPPTGDLLGLVLNNSEGAQSLITPAGVTMLCAAGALARHDRRAHVVLLGLAGLGATAGPLALAGATVLALIVALWPQTAEPAHTTTPSECSHTGCDANLEAREVRGSQRTSS